MSFAEVDGSRFYYEIVGNGPPLILVTGLAGLASYWEPNIADLAQYHTVLRYDHRGTGQSVRSEQEYSIEQLTDDLIGLMDSLRWARASVVGHSTGGAIGQVLAARWPQRVDRMVLYGSWSTICPQMRLCMDLRLNLLEAFGAEGFHKASPVFLYPPRYVCDAWDKIEESFVAAVANTTTPSILAARVKAVVNYDGRPYLAGIATPTLVLVAQDDILTPVSASEELVSGIANAKLQVLSYGAHAVSYCEPESFKSAVISFLNV
jgi:aminoacrylate hydrolase